MVARLSRTLCHQVLGWKRSSAIRQPPVAPSPSPNRPWRSCGTPAAASASARCPRRIAQQPTERSHTNGRRTGSIRWAARSLSAVRWCPRCRAARIRCRDRVCPISARGSRRVRGAVLGADDRQSRADGLRRSLDHRALARLDATTAATSEWPIRYSSSAERRSGLIGTTDAPSPFRRTSAGRTPAGSRAAGRHDGHDRSPARDRPRPAPTMRAWTCAVAQLAGRYRVGLGRLGQHGQEGAIAMPRGRAGKRVEHGGRSLGRQLHGVAYMKSWMLPKALRS